MSNDLQVTIPIHGTFRLSPDAKQLHPIYLATYGSLEGPDIIQSHDNGVVCRATWTGQTLSSSAAIRRSLPTRVVFKLYYCDSRLNDLEHEARMYAHASKVQGSVIPRCFGLFAGVNVENEDERVKLLLLEDCGDPRRHSNGKLVLPDEFSLKQSLAIIKCLVLLHQDGGLEHHDFEPRNIVWLNDERPVIVDLGHAKRHECDQRLVISPMKLYPDIDEFGCFEVHDRCVRYGIWFHDEVCFAGVWIPAKDIHTLEDVIQPAAERGVRIDDRALEVAKQVFAHIKFRRDHYPESLEPRS
ncbi:hypothetical protein PUNSTDRAFT_52812 [Punctularia strigosozonata HHB-11173 SS5]|uniref:uncharacterized protein n=1 Tax=Punctularia strigosozonata (strain HHB-11173) TaxID=741275 RepID=UPI0004417EE0|nr:uncharacterized protein PUNSTDRAFT_52812 [Punctularia strigosozonata HHB-11173 SS5]EIN08375.1 hypothetical protein PUNSTDRAFT_52812 [Punctularia strigosozonata HHB-11173 SS5]